MGRVIGFALSTFMIYLISILFAYFIATHIGNYIANLFYIITNTLKEVMISTNIC